MKIIKAIADRVKGKVPLFARRSPKWQTVRKDFIEANAACEACGETEKLEVHHVKPFHLDKSLELEVSNLMTLCDKGHKCHLNIGHLGSWRKENPQAREMAAQLKKTLLG